jgi:hypothetical protein
MTVRPWLDPVRWSGLARAWALLLMTLTVSAYARAVTQMFAAWIPSGLEILLQPETATFPALVLVIPYLSSQLMTGLWLLRRARIRKPDATNRCRTIAAVAIEDVMQLGLLRRRPRLAIGRVGQPVVASVFGVRVLVLPDDLVLWEHLVGDEAEIAFRGVILHELGHVYVWDDLLNTPWIAYVGCAVAAIGVGFGLAFLGRLPIVEPLRLLIVFAGLALGGVYVVRRRVAFADAFAVVIDRREAPIRAAIGALPLRSGAGPHFSAVVRSAWLGRAGGPFFESGPLDLALIVAMLVLPGVDAPLGTLSTSLGGIGSMASFVDGLIEMGIRALTLWSLVGLVIARAGRRPPARAFVIALVSWVLIEACYRFITEVGPSIGWSPIPLVNLVLSGLVVDVPAPLVVCIVTTAWASALISSGLVDPRNVISRVVKRFVAWQAIVGAVTAIWMHTTVARMVIDPAFLDANAGRGRTFEMLVGAFLLNGIGYGGLLSMLWSRRSARRVRWVTCDACGAAQPTATGLHLTCSRCARLLREDIAVPVAA